MVEDRNAGASRYGPLFRTAEEIRVAQGRIRAASARQRRLAASMRTEALESRATWVRWHADHRRGRAPITDRTAWRGMTAACTGDLTKAIWQAQPVPGQHMKMTAPARAEAVGGLRRELKSFAHTIGACELALEGVALAVSEALTNVVVHAYAHGQPGPMTIEAWSDRDGHLLVLVSDEGTGTGSHADSRGMGLGIPVMGEMADDVDVASGDGLPGTVVSLRFSLDGSGMRRAAGDTA